VKDFPTVATARTQPTWRQSAAAGSMSAVQEIGNFLTLQARSLCEGRSFLGVAGAFRGALLLRTIRFFETTPPLAARSSFTAPVIQNANS
jgi:hypothetical protein